MGKMNILRNLTRLLSQKLWTRFGQVELTMHILDTDDSQSRLNISRAMMCDTESSPTLTQNQ